jgi:hypothetical protein
MLPAKKASPATGKKVAAPAAKVAIPAKKSCSTEESRTAE